jgi:cytochrome c oxidase cbb3-type subunit 3
MRVVWSVFLLLGLFSCTKKPAVPAVAQTEAQMNERLKDPRYMDQARLAFQNVCARCHGLHGEGGVGPNLTDKYWIHGDGQIMTLIRTIQQGAPEKGMPAWEAISTQEEIEQAAAFVYSLAGSEPKNAKAPQGDLKN